MLKMFIFEHFQYEKCQKWKIVSNFWQNFAIFFDFSQLPERIDKNTFLSEFEIEILHSTHNAVFVIFDNFFRKFQKIFMKIKNSIKWPFLPQLLLEKSLNFQNF